MPTSPIFHAVTFAVGAAVGATTAISIANRRKEPPTPTPTTVRAVVEVGPNGTIGLAQQAPIAGDVLKYGNPGTCYIEKSPPQLLHLPIPMLL
jgi:hypothetical protein